MTTLSKETIKALQQRLTELGFSCSNSGILTNNTLNAYVNYCRKMGITPTNLETATTINTDLAAPPAP